MDLKRLKDGAYVDRDTGERYSRRQGDKLWYGATYDERKSSGYKTQVIKWRNNGGEVKGNSESAQAFKQMLAKLNIINRDNSLTTKQKKIQSIAIMRDYDIIDEDDYDYYISVGYF